MIGLKSVSVLVNPGTKYSYVLKICLPFSETFVPGPNLTPVPKVKGTQRSLFTRTRRAFSVEVRSVTTEKRPARSAGCNKCQMTGHFAKVQYTKVHPRKLQQTHSLT